MLIATDYARKMSLDMRLIDPLSYGDDKDNKATHCADMIAKYYNKYAGHKGTQFVFSDLGTYKPDQWNPYSEIKRKLVEDHGIPEDQIRFIQEAKTEKKRKAMIEAMNEERYVFSSALLKCWARESTPRSGVSPSITSTHRGGLLTCSSGTAGASARATRWPSSMRTTRWT